MRHQQDSSGRHSLRCMEIWGGSHAVESEVKMPGLDAWVYSRPFEGADRGGDVHYVSLCGGGLITRAIVADVSGHGLAAGEMSLKLRDIMRKFINSKSQTRMARALNKEFAEQAKLSRFATAVIASFRAARDRLTICNAGHPRPLWYRADKKEWFILSAELADADHVRPQHALNLPLGLDNESTYDLFSIVLSKGDLVLLYTDALTESEDASGRMLGEPGLLDIARTLDSSHPQGVGAGILDGIARQHGGKGSDDDLTLLVLHHTAGPKRRPTLGEKLDVYAKVFRLKRV